MAGDVDLGRFMPAVAAELLGEPNVQLSSKGELRYGSHGSLSVDLAKGTWFDHELNEGGGVLDLIARETGRHTNGAAGGAAEWLREHGLLLDEPHAQPARPQRAKIVAQYDYVDEQGELVFQVVRFEPKTFRQRRRATDADAPDRARDGWVWSVKGVRQVPYRLPDLVEAIALERTIFIAEGEKDADNLWRVGLPATTNAMGAGKWPDDLNRYFAGADVVILPDKDDAGRNHAAVVSAALTGEAARIRVLDLPGLPDKGDVSDWIAAGGDSETLLRLLEQDARPPGQEPIKSRFGAIWFRDVERQQTNRTEWVAKGLLGVRDFSSFYGAPKGGKSFLALDLSLTISGAAVSTDGAVPFWFGHRVAPGGVIYIAAEGQRGLLRRVIAWRVHRGVAADQNIPFVLVPTRVDLRSENSDTQGLIEEIAMHAARMPVPPALIVVDTVARAMAGGDENTGKDMGAFVDNCGRLGEGVRAHVLAVHHVGKDEARGLRGHNSLRGALDTAIEVGKAEDGGNLWTLRDQKEGEAGASHAFRLQPVTIGVDDDGDTITSCVVVPSETSLAPAGQTKKQTALPDQARIALRQLHEAILDIGQRPPSGGPIPVNVKAVEWKTWRDYCYRGGITANDASDDAKQKAFKRAGELLRARSYIGSWDAWVWPSRRAD